MRFIWITNFSNHKIAKTHLLIFRQKLTKLEAKIDKTTNPYLESI